MKNTNIEWTDHTLNFWWGCTKVSPACTHCYAESVSKVFGKRLFGAVPQWGKGQPRFERLKAARKEALKLNKAAAKTQFEADVMKRNGLHLQYPERYAELAYRPRVFVNSMSDWLDNEVPIEWLAYLLETLFLCPNLDFQLLTKRPENWLKRCREVYDDHAETRGANFEDGLLDWIKGTPPPNLWIGITAENQEWADKRIPHLLSIPAAVRFLSCEPLLSAVDLSVSPYPLNIYREADRVKVYTNDPIPLERPGRGLVIRRSGEPSIHWVIAGGESGGHARPSHPDWFRSLRAQCTAAGVPFFFKQWGEWISVDNAKDCAGGRLDKKYRGWKFLDNTLALRIGVLNTGRLLDGVEHSAFPQ